MYSRNTSITSGQPFNIKENKVINSVSGSWTNIADATAWRAVRIQGVYWDATTVGTTLYIRDVERVPTNTGFIIKPGAVWYTADCLGGSPAVDQFTSHLTLFTPFQYFDTGGGNTIIIYGEFV